MSSIYLTPASISYLNQLILAFLITIYLALRFRQHQRIPLQDRLLLFFFLGITLFSFTLFLDVSQLSSGSLLAAYVENPILALLLIFLMQFAYVFPFPREEQKNEQRVALIVSSLYLLSEILFSIWRFYRVGLGKVEFRHPYFEYPLLFAFIWVVFVFARSAILHLEIPSSRRFALIFLIPLSLALLNVLVAYYNMASIFYHISMSVGILVTTLLFTMNYLASKPETTSLLVKISGVALTSLLAVFGVIPWLITPVYAAQYKPNIPDQRTLRFSPNQSGGYDVDQIPFHFEEDLGEDQKLTVSPFIRSDVRVDGFPFRFFGHRYESLNIINNGIIVFGGDIEYRDLEYHFANVPAIFPLLVNLNPEISPDGKVFLRRDPEKLVITNYRLPGFYRPEWEFTFQTVLYSDGKFDLTYNGVPQDMPYYVNDRPGASPWILGAQPGDSTPQWVDLSRLPISGGPEGLIQDENRAFREYLHRFLLPLVIAILASSLFLVTGVPLLLNAMLARPLNALLDGVALFNQGQRAHQIPVQFNDEIGFLTMSFNDLGSELDGLIKTLEHRVAERTSDLVAVNEQLRKLSSAVEQSPSTIVITNRAAIIEYVNPAFTHSTGYSSDEVIGKNPRILKSDRTAHETYKDMWMSLTEGMTWRGELCNRRKDGTEYWEYSVIAPIYDQQGNVTHYVAVKEDVSERKKIEEELNRLAITDPLTGLVNRRHFFAEAQKIFLRAKAKSPACDLAALMIDIDYFKQVNDRYGHPAGDLVLQEVARRIQNSLRPSDLLGRYGGEEFIVLLSRTEFIDIYQIADRLLTSVNETPITANGLDIPVTISIGIARSRKITHSIDELVSNADRSLYQAKSSGRNRWATV